MKNIAKFLILISSIFIIYFTIAAQSAKICGRQSCDSRGPVVRFPFQLKDRQPAGCGQPGFDLYCDIRGRTIINLPESGEFVVRDINYRTQSLHIDDPRSCLPSRSLNFSLTGSPFRGLLMSRFVYFNCSDRWTDYDSSVYFVPLDCLSRENDTVVAVNPASPGADQVPPPCRRMTEVSIPLQWSVSRVTFWLGWTEPECQRCENQGGVCGYKDDSGQEIGCSRHAAAGLARSAKYAIIIGVGIPGLICIVGLACYSLGMIKHGSFQRHLNGSHLSATSTTQLPITRAVAAGLDGPTIESYPKTILGESRRFPKSSDGTCSICLSEYQPKEILRSIPECNHCFHADCIDEWLKLNGTCPVCRSSPDSSSLATTPCSSNVSSPSSSDSATLDHHH